VIPKLTDWGMGYTLAYAPPEVVIGGEKPDEQADIWSLGVILYELIMGYNPFQGEDDIETMERIMDLDPDMRNLGTLREIVEKCLQKDKEKRYRSMIDVKRDLASLNITYLSSMLSSIDVREKRESAVEIVSVYVASRDFEKAEKRVKFLARCKYISPNAHEVYRTVFEILKAEELSLNDVKMKYYHILNLMPDYKDLFEKDENVGLLLKKILLAIGNVQDKLKHGDTYFDLIKNVFCNRIIDLLGEISLSSLH
jgi:serine/threonine protein kinase